MTSIIDQSEEPNNTKNEEDNVLTMIGELNEMSTEIKNMEDEFLSYHNYYDSTPKSDWSKDDHWKISFGYFKCAMRVYVLTQRTSCYNYPNEKIKTIELAEKKKTYYQTKRYHMCTALDEIKMIPRIRDHIDDYMHRKNNKKTVEESTQEHVLMTEPMPAVIIKYVSENVKEEHGDKEEHDVQDVQDVQDNSEHILKNKILSVKTVHFHQSNLNLLHKSDKHTCLFL